MALTATGSRPEATPLPVRLYPLDAAPYGFEMVDRKQANLPMATRRALLAGAGAVMAGPAFAASAAGAYWPTTTDWMTADPAVAGFDAAALGAALDAAMSDRTASLLVLRGGRIVAERYGPGRDLRAAQEVASVGKSMLSVLTGMAIDDGRIKSLDQSAADFIPAWAGTPKAQITIRHLITMTSGLDDQGLALRNVAGDQFALNAAAPSRDPPGTRWAYNTAVYHLLFHVLERAAGERFEAYAKRKLLAPLGMADTTWLTNVGQGAGRPVTNYYTAVSSARDLARFALFAQRGGQWSGRRLVSESYLKASVSPSQTLNPAYGYLWWENAQPGFAAAGRSDERALQFVGAPRDAFAALGAGGQVAAAVPSLDLVVVRQGQAPAAGARARVMLAAICNALPGPAAG